MRQPLTTTVNGVERELDAPPDESLLAALRERLDLTGAKISCAEGACGACTVLLDGRAVRSCVTPIAEAAGRAILTIEGLATPASLHPLQQAFIDAGAFQCGYCTPGMIMAATALLAQNPAPTEGEVVAALQGNICRCGMYARIVRAVLRAAPALHGPQTGGDER
jgi:aerobic-type carbon monoxide dehydrogenase small subunit (CoxS/CutS family)